MDVTMCEMCPKKIDNLVTGLCDRCMPIWAEKTQPEKMRFTLDQTRAMIVGMARGPQDLRRMDPVFRVAAKRTRLLRLQKVQLFQKVRFHFQQGILNTPFHDPQPKYVVEEDYWNVPDILDEDLISFQKDIDLLSDVPQQLAKDPDQNNNKNPKI
ncbi:uncharacterized protein LOC108098905 [Drosophila ficusphila]|uniref:uncharacterized protein LOC108098905 n=1 Tax=Drosophila ficusphila TaxID=30025 RepID=UPI0007E79FBA|nr:uncharacterized protein LOC108098905 [Drosophila ficusphila]